MFFFSYLRSPPTVAGFSLGAGAMGNLEALGLGLCNPYCEVFKALKPCIFPWVFEVQKAGLIPVSKKLLAGVYVPHIGLLAPLINTTRHETKTHLVTPQGCEKLERFLCGVCVELT